MVDMPSNEGAEGSRPVKVGVLLDLDPGRIGEWLADAAAFDAGGADALWVDSGPEPELDVLALTAALAVVTFRARLVVAIPDSATATRDTATQDTATQDTATRSAATWGTAPAGLARTLETIRRLSRGRLVLVADSSRCAELAVLAPGAGVFRRVPGEPDTFEDTRPGLDAERWVATPVPQGRASWQTAREDAAECGARGLVVPADPRLLDILRNPDDPGERHDLQLAQG